MTFHSCFKGCALKNEISITNIHLPRNVKSHPNEYHHKLAAGHIVLLPFTCDAFLPCQVKSSPGEASTYFLPHIKDGWWAALITEHSIQMLNLFVRDKAGIVKAEIKKGVKTPVLNSQSSTKRLFVLQWPQLSHL